MNEQFVRKLLTKIPSNIKVSVYLMELLELGREAVYRRIRGKIPFTVAEVLKISIALNVSIDDIINNDDTGQDRVDYNINLIKSIEYDQIFHSSLGQLYSQFLSKENTTITFAINRFHAIFFVNYSEIFKFFYYQWLCQNGEIHLTKNFSETVLPPELLQLQQQVRLGIQQLNLINMIIDCNVFANLVKEINYFEQRKLITNQEKQLLKTEIINFIDSYEQLTKRGLFGSKPLLIYLSTYLPIYTNLGLVQSGTECQSFFRLNTIPHQITKNQQVCDLQKTGLDFLKRQAVCITQSNEILQEDFFAQQRQLIESL